MAYSATLFFTADLPADAADDPADPAEIVAEGLAGTIGLPTAGDPHYEVSWIVDEPTVRQAIGTAFTIGTTLIRAAGFTRLVIAGVEVLDDDLAERAVNTPTVPELVDYSWIAEQQQFSRQRARQISLESDDFPPPVGPGPVFVRSAVERFFARERPVGRPRKEGSRHA
jgi:hypothetical protein